MDFFKISKFFLYLALFSVILVSTQTLFPFIVIKYTFFRAAVGLALIFFIFGLGFHSEKIRNFHLGNAASKIKSPLVIAVSIFISVFLLAGLFAFDPSMAFWSNFERGEGVFQLLTFYVYFLLLVLLFNGEKDWRTAFWVSLTAAGLMIFYGLLAHFGVPGIIGSRISSDTRFYGSLGNPAYVGTYLIFILGYASYLFSTSKKMPTKYFLICLSIIYLIFFWLAQGRGAVAGLVIGVLTALIYSAFKNGPKWRKVILVFFGSFLVLLIVLFIFRDSVFTLQTPFFHWLNVSFSGRSFQSRLWTWESALKGWQERPVLGWGPENFAVAFDKYFDVRHYNPSQLSETWYDRAHNVFLDYLVETGLLGLLSFLAIFFSFYLQFFRTNPFPGQAIVFALPIAYLVQGIVIFDVLPIYLNLFLFLAFAVYKFYPVRENT